MVGEGAGGDSGTGELDARPAIGLTFLFTSPQNTPQLLERLGSSRYKTVFDEHQQAVHKSLLKFGGLEVERDPGFVAFSDPNAALSAAAAVVTSVLNHPDRDVEALGIGIGIHFGDALRAGDEFVGLEVNRAARICAVANSGQVVLSEAMVNAVSPKTQSWQFKDLGRHRLKDLGEPQRLYQLIVDGVESSFPPLRSLEAFPTNLPIQLTPFIGRTDDLNALEALLGDESTRVLTLTGPGGVGKTRLALQAAAAQVQAFSDGVYFVGLASTTDAAFLLETIAEALGLQQSDRSLLDAVASALSDRRVLVVLDNFEQLISSAGLIGSLLERCRDLKILATSRIRLGIEGERQYIVEPFIVPGVDRQMSAAALASFDSVALFVERTQAVKPSFSLTNENANAIGAICSRLDGIPLAIELAAAKSKLFAPAALLQRLTTSLPILKGSHRDAPSRQATLLNTIKWSYDLLEEKDQRLLDRLSVFSDGFTTEAAASVCGSETGLDDVARSLSTLTENSLLKARSAHAQRGISSSLGESEHFNPRFDMLVMIKEFAFDQLRQSGEVNHYQGLHAQYFTDWVKACHDRWVGDGAFAAVTRFQHEASNLNTAIDWALAQNERELALRLVSPCWPFWFLSAPWRTVQPKLQAVTEIIDHEMPATSDTAAGIFIGNAAFYMRLLQLDELEHYVRRALALPDERISLRYRAVAWFALAVLQLSRGELGQETERNYLKAQRLAERSGTKLIQDWCRADLATLEFLRGNLDKASRLFHSIISDLCDSENSYAYMMTAGSLGNIELLRGDFKQALTWAFKALDSARSIELTVMGVPEFLVVAAAALRTNKPELAATILSQADELGSKAGYTIGDTRQVREQTLATLHNQLSQSDFDKAWLQGQQLSLDEATELIEAELQGLT